MSSEDKFTGPDMSQMEDESDVRDLEEGATIQEYAMEVVRPESESIGTKSTTSALELTEHEYDEKKLMEEAGSAKSLRQDTESIGIEAEHQDDAKTFTEKQFLRHEESDSIKTEPNASSMELAEHEDDRKELKEETSEHFLRQRYLESNTDCVDMVEQETDGEARGLPVLHSVPESDTCGPCNLEQLEQESNEELEVERVLENYVQEFLGGQPIGAEGFASSSHDAEEEPNEAMVRAQAYNSLRILAEETEALAARPYLEAATVLAARRFLDVFNAHQEHLERYFEHFYDSDSDQDE